MATFIFTHLLALAVLLRVDAISHHFGRLQALDRVSFSVEAGTVLGVIGPNGAGKSTALAAVAGLLTPSSGRIVVHGEDQPPAARRQQCFFLPDGICPWRDQPASWVLTSGAHLFGATEDWTQALGPALSLAPFVHQRMGELSKGQRKRVLLALALLVPRPLTLIDEPFDGLDPRQARAFTALVRARAASGRAFVCSIHSAGDAMRTCDAHLLLHDGRVLASGSLAALRAQANVADNAGLEEVFLALT